MLYNSFKWYTFVKNKMTVMEKLFKVSRFTLENDKFEFSHFDEYKINFLKGKKAHFWKIVVNGVISKEVINILHPRSEKGYKDKILKSVSQLVNKEIVINEGGVKKVINNTHLKQLYSPSIIKILKMYLEPISKETSRDVLTSYNLI